MDERERTTDTAKDMVTRVAAFIRPCLPFHSAAILDQIAGRRLSEERWHKIKNILGSARALLLAPLSLEEMEVRAVASSASYVCGTMAGVIFNMGRDGIFSWADARRMCGEVMARLPSTAACGTIGAQDE